MARHLLEPGTRNLGTFDLRQLLRAMLYGYREMILCGLEPDAPISEQDGFNSSAGSQ
jgi:hypothetical protein